MSIHKPTEETCGVEGCPSPQYCKKLCTKHYNRLRAHGDPTVTLVPVRGMPLAERLWMHVDRTVGSAACWPFRGTVHADGYGLVHHQGKSVRAHRLAYELTYGPIPADLLPDHTCHTAAAAAGQCDGGRECPHRACVNPSHIELTTSRENNLRGMGHAATNARKTRCVNGHPFDEANTYYDPAGRRSCRTCVRARGRIYDQTKRVRVGGAAR